MRNLTRHLETGLHSTRFMALELFPDSSIFLNFFLIFGVVDLDIETSFIAQQNLLQIKSLKLLQTHWGPHIAEVDGSVSLDA